MKNLSLDSNSFSGSVLNYLFVIPGLVYNDKFIRLVSPPASKRSSEDDNNTDGDYDEGDYVDGGTTDQSLCLQLYV